jgi:hypothetical protein
MRKQPMKSDTNTQTARYPIQKERNKQPFPTEKEEGGDCTDMEKSQEN